MIQKPVKGVTVPIENSNAPAIESVGDILEPELESMIQHWLCRVKKESDLTNIPLNLENVEGISRTLAGGDGAVASERKGQELRFRRPQVHMGICITNRITEWIPN